MWEGNHYCWVVMCKNHWFHHRQNINSGHRIPLGETDVYASPPALKSSFTARCDDCGKEYLYEASDVLRYEQDLPESFTPHPLFRLDGSTRADEKTGKGANEWVKGQERRRSPRLLLDVQLVVRGESVEKEPFQEETFTISISAHGALVLLSTKVALGQTLFLKNSRTKKEMESRVTRLDPLHGGFAPVGVEFARPAPKFWPV
jgi:hypothetical protein